MSGQMVKSNDGRVWVEKYVSNPTRPANFTAGAQNKDTRFEFQGPDNSRHIGRALNIAERVVRK